VVAAKAVFPVAVAVVVVAVSAVEEVAAAGAVAVEEVVVAAVDSKRFPIKRIMSTVCGGKVTLIYEHIALRRIR
jgi:hypothetical protein